MPFSAGIFSRLYNWATEQLSPPIEISKLDQQEEDVATALSNCILRDGTGSPTQNIDWNSKKITGLADAAAATDALNRQSADGRYLSNSNDTVTYAKIQNVSATDKVLGRSSSGAGDIEEIPCTAAGRALIDDADAAAQRTTLGLGTAATQASSAFAATSHTHSEADFTGGRAAFKATNTDRASSTSLSDDPDLVVALVAGTYEYQLVTFYRNVTSTTQGFKAAINFSGTRVLHVAAQIQYNGSAFSGFPNSSSASLESGFGLAAQIADTTYMLIAKGTITVSNSGNLKLQWAQTVSDGNATRVEAGSHLTVRRIS